MPTFLKIAASNFGSASMSATLTAGYAHLGQTAKAAEALTRYRELEPAASITHLRRQLPYRNAEQAERLWEGLRKAGLPE
jgi:adenylate cyclase